MLLWITQRTDLEASENKDISPKVRFMYSQKKIENENSINELVVM